ncbi:MAG: methionine biosynthesis protein MetW [Candidatus Omnitrophota bacterium]
MKILRKIVVLFLIQVVLLANTAFADLLDSQRVDAQVLSPAISINSAEMSGLFASFVQLEQELKLDQAAVAEWPRAGSSDQGDGKLNSFNETIAAKKQGSAAISVYLVGSLLGKLSLIKNKFTLINLLFSPLLFALYGVNKIFDLYYFFYPEYDMTRIIKSRFASRFVQVLDVGTGSGEFIERLQKVLAEKRIDAFIQGIELKASNVVKAQKRGLLVHSMDVKDLEDKYGKNRFHLIAVNAPDVPLYCVEKSMKVLKPEGILILRTARLFFSIQDQEKLIQVLSEKYNVKVFDKKIYNLPNGFFSKLHKPLFVTHKANLNPERTKNLDLSSGARGNLYGLQMNLEKRIKKIEVLTRSGELFQAARAFMRITEKNEQLNAVRLGLVMALKTRADDLFESADYQAAIEYYQKIIQVAPQEKVYNFYIGACYLMQSDNRMASQYIARVKKWQSHSPIYALADFILETIELSEQIAKKDANLSSQVREQRLQRYNKLCASVDYILNNYLENIELFSSDNPVDNTIINEFVSTYVSALDKLERILRQRKFLLKDSGVLKLVEKTKVANPRQVLEVDFKLKNMVKPLNNNCLGLIIRSI